MAEPFKQTQKSLERAETITDLAKQALLDFANIRDQQDVDEFNQRYNVNLNISQEG